MRGGAGGGGPIRDTLRGCGDGLWAPAHDLLFGGPAFAYTTVDLAALVVTDVFFPTSPSSALP